METAEILFIAFLAFVFGLGGSAEVAFGQNGLSGNVGLVPALNHHNGLLCRNVKRGKDKTFYAIEPTDFVQGKYWQLFLSDQTYFGRVGQPVQRKSFYLGFCFHIYLQRYSFFLYGRF